jgi:hypothetical protein
LHRRFAAQREPATLDLQQARRAALQHLQPTTGADAELSHAANPGRVAGNFGNIRPLTGPEEIKREESFRMHRAPIAHDAEKSFGLLRLNLNLDRIRSRQRVK